MSAFTAAAALLGLVLLACGGVYATWWLACVERTAVRAVPFSGDCQPPDHSGAPRT
jgi:hypothetical protein